MEDAKNTTTTDNSSSTTIDYEAEYKKVVAERDGYKAEAEKQKRMKDQYATENADYKKKELDKMSDEEKKNKEFNEIVASNEQMKAEIAQMKLEKECLSHKFTAEETEILVKANVSFDSVKEIAKIIQTRVDEAIKSAKAELTKGSSKDLLGNGSTANGEAKSGFQKHQENKQTNKNIVEF